MGLLKQFDKIIVVAEALVHTIEVDDVITAVRPARYVHRVQPDGRHADGLDVVQPGDDSLEVAVAIPVAVLEGRRINLVEDRVAQPARLRRILGLQADAQEARKCECQ